MATHDYVLANASGAAFRTDLNNALAAIVSNNSNSSEPATMYAYQWWADTNTGTLKIRNSANNGWVELLQLDGTLTLEDGTVSAPALAFRDDLNTGLFSSAADKINFATGGVERMEIGDTTIFNEDGADVDFRIEGDSVVNMFYVDAGNNRVGFGTDSPASFINAVTSDTTVLNLESTAAGGTGVELILHHNSASPADNDNIGAIYFQADHDGGNKHTFAYILTQATDVSDGSEDANLFMFTSTAGSATQKLRLNDEGIALSNLASGGGMAIDQASGGASSKYCQIGMNAHRTGDFDTLGQIVTSWNSDSVATIRFTAGNDTTNKDNGKIGFLTQPDSSSSEQFRMLIDEDGKVGIGTTAPAQTLHLDSGGATTQIQIDSDTESSISFNDHGGSAITYHIGTNISDNNSQFEIRDVTNGASRVRIHSSGHFLFRCTSANDSGDVGIKLFNSSTVPYITTTIDSSAATTSFYHVYNKNASNNGYRFYVLQNGGIANHSGNNQNLSDERMKKNITNMGSVYDIFKQFVFKDFNYISEADSITKKHGVIAQDVETIDSDLVTEDFKVSVDSEGNDVLRKGLREEQFMMIGLKALQEAIAKIEVLETKVAALEAA